MSELHLTLPESWDQLSEKQLLYLSRLLFEKVPEQELLTRCFLKFSGLLLIQQNPVIIREKGKNLLCYEFRKKGLEKYTVDVDTFTEAVSKLNWIANDVKLFHNIPKIKRYTGCNYKILDKILEEYLIADNAYLAFVKKGDIKYLDKLVAIFYRKKSDKWDDGNNLTSWAKRFSGSPVHVKYSVFLWYTGLKAWIIKKYPYIFSSPGSGTSSASDSVLAILSALSGGDISKNPEIKRSNCHEALDILNRKMEVIQTK